jgi:hypothetical protein
MTLLRGFVCEVGCGDDCIATGMPQCEVAISSLPTMPKPMIDRKPFQGFITTWFKDDISLENTAN